MSFLDRTSSRALMNSKIAGRRHGTARQQEIQRRNRPGITSQCIRPLVPRGLWPRSEPDILLAALSEFVRQNRIEWKVRFALKTLGGQRKKLGRSDENSRLGGLEI